MARASSSRSRRFCSASRFLASTALARSALRRFFTLEMAEDTSRDTGRDGWRAPPDRVPVRTILYKFVSQL